MSSQPLFPCTTCAYLMCIDKSIKYDPLEASLVTEKVASCFLLQQSAKFIISNGALHEEEDGYLPTSCLILSFLPIFYSRHPFSSLSALRVNLCQVVLWNVLKLCFKFEDVLSRALFTWWIFTDPCGRALKKFHHQHNKVKVWWKKKKWGALHKVLM